MKLFPNETFLVYRTRLIGDVVFLMYWDLDCHGKPECVGQFVRIGRMDPLPLKNPLLLIRPPIIDGIYEKRELACLIGEEVERKRPYLDRMGQKLRTQMETLILTGYPYYQRKEENSGAATTVSEAYRRFIFLLGFLFWWGGPDEGEEEKKRPP